MKKIESPQIGGIKFFYALPQEVNVVPLSLPQPIVRVGSTCAINSATTTYKCVVVIVALPSGATELVVHVGHQNKPYINILHDLGHCSSAGKGGAIVEVARAKLIFRDNSPELGGISPTALSAEVRKDLMRAFKAAGHDVQGIEFQAR
jgi:hypothetical protein